MALQLIEMEDGFSCYASGEFEARFIYQEIFQDYNYDQAALPQAPFIVDVGANIGLFSLYMKRKYPEARIVAFEPAPENFQALTMNLKLHGTDGVEAHPYGLATRAGRATFTYYPQMPGNSTLHPDEKALQKSMMGERLGEERAAELFTATEITVDLAPLSAFLAEHHPGLPAIDLLKIDVEGAELEVLGGIDDRHWPLIGNILLEVSDAKGALAPVEALLRDKGFEVSSEPVPFMWEELQFYYVTARR